MNELKEIKLPNSVVSILKKIEKAGFESYVVGGCVRDSLLGIKPKDWDICTNATPVQIKEIFINEKIYNIGERFGTIGILKEGVIYEITTYRKDGIYDSSNRHPTSIELVSTIHEDLARRDFTINALAYNLKKELITTKGGLLDLKKGIIRCVGNPFDRFNEDALRILRCLRFASRFGFEIESETQDALLKSVNTLSKVSKERIRDELLRILQNKPSISFFEDTRLVFEYLIPNISNLSKLDWMLLSKALKGVVKTNYLEKLIILFIPYIIQNKVFNKSELLSYLYSMRLCNKDITYVIAVLESLHYHIDKITNTSNYIVYYRNTRVVLLDFKNKPRVVSQSVIKILRELLIQNVLNIPFNESVNLIGLIREVGCLLDKKYIPLKVKELALKGGSLIELGYKGIEIGIQLDLLLDDVILGSVSNTKKSLLGRLKGVSHE